MNAIELLAGHPVCPVDKNSDKSYAEGWNDCLRQLCEKAEEASHRIPCDVMLPPSTIIKRGCSLNTLLAAMEQREKFPAKDQVFGRKKQAEPPAPFRSMN